MIISLADGGDNDDGLDVPTAKLFLIPTGKLMVPAGSSWFLLVVPVGRLCGSCWSAYGFFCQYYRSIDALGS
ncbi:hypothetical protein Tco_0435864 [Tanacetum coccineum]